MGWNSEELVKELKEFGIKYKLVHEQAEDKDVITIGDLFSKKYLIFTRDWFLYKTEHGNFGINNKLIDYSFDYDDGAILIAEFPTDDVNFNCSSDVHVHRRTYETWRMLLNPIVEGSKND